MEVVVKRIYTFALLALLWSGSALSIEGMVFKDAFEGPAVITGFSAEPATVAAGHSTTISWTTELATSCTPTGGAGGWGSQSIKLPGGSAQIVIPDVNTYTFTLTCEGEVGDPVVEEVMITVVPAAAITAFSAIPDVMMEGEATTINWTTENATSCIPSGGASGWDETVINLPGSTVPIVIPSAGFYIFTLTCEGSVGDSVMAEAAVTVIAPAAITAFTATPDAINEGESTTISWTTENAVSCTPSGGASGWSLVEIDLPDGEIEIPIASEDVVTFILTCEGAGGDPDVAEVEVTVRSNRTVCYDSPLLGTTWAWSDFWGVEFPLPTYDNKLVDVYRFGYDAFEFNTGSVVDNGLLVTVGVTFTQGTRLGAITKCPGDFNAPPECQHSWGIGGGIEWATDGLEGACQLEPDTTYYLNITFTDGFDKTESSCEKSPCYTKVQAVNRD